MKKYSFYLCLAVLSFLMHKYAQADAFPDDMCMVMQAEEEQVRVYINSIYFIEKKSRHTRNDGSVNYAGLLIGQHDLDAFPEVLSRLRSSEDLARGDKAYFAYDRYHFIPVDSKKTKVCLELLYLSTDFGPLKNAKVSITENTDNPKLGTFFSSKRAQVSKWMEELKLQIETSALDWEEVHTKISCPALPSSMRILIKNTPIKDIRQWLYQNYKGIMITTRGEVSFGSRFTGPYDIEKFFGLREGKHYAKDSYSFHATPKGMEVCLDVLYVFPQENPPDTEISISTSSKNPLPQEKLEELQENIALWLGQLKQAVEH